MREIDLRTMNRSGVESLVLMENAAEAVVRVVSEYLSREINGKRILVLCGKGNNGGDGAAVARLLATSGARVDIVLLGTIEETKGDARVNFERLQSWNDEVTLREARKSAQGETGILNLFECETEKAWAQLANSLLTIPADVTIDALFGTGLTRPVEGIYAEAIKYLGQLRDGRDSANDQSTFIVAVDIPSGLNSDANEIIGEAVRADVTVTMTAPKLANILPPASNCNGKLIVADIGSAAGLIEFAKANL